MRFRLAVDNDRTVLWSACDVDAGASLMVAGVQAAGRLLRNSGSFAMAGRRLQSPGCVDEKPPAITAASEEDDRLAMLLAARAVRSV